MGSPIQQYASELHKAAEEIAKHVGHRASTSQREDGSVHFRCHKCGIGIDIPSSFNQIKPEEQELYNVIRQQIRKYVGTSTAAAMAKWDSDAFNVYVDTVSESIMDAILSNNLGPL